MTQEGLRRHVLRVLRMWRSWSIFSDDFLNGLQVEFVTSPNRPAFDNRASVLHQLLLPLRLVDLFWVHHLDPL